MDFQITHDDLWWLFSTIAQTYGAIVALFAMLVVYRLERLNRISDDCWKRAEEPVKYLRGEEAVGVSAEDYIDKWTKIPLPDAEKYKKSPDAHTRISFAKAENESMMIKRYMWWGKNLRLNFMIFLGYHVPLIIVAISLVPMADELSIWIQGCGKTSMYVLGAILLISVFCIVALGFTLVSDLFITKRYLAVSQSPNTC